MNRFSPLLATGLLFAWVTAALAQAPAPAPSAAPGTPTYSGTIQVTATRVPEDVELVPTSIQVISGEELRARGATDLASALALLAGVDIAPGGDGGPAASVPEFWGLKEFDAFLLVVDGVPWGGAFNPALATLDLDDVERIEVQRGPAPVMYGATSFVGVVQVVRKVPAAGSPGSGRVSLGGGSYGSGSGSLSASLPAWLGFDSRVSAGYEHRGFADDRTSYDKGHVLWRNRRVLEGGGEGHRGAFSFDFDATFLRQDPASPSPRAGRVLSPRAGRVLSPLVPVDSNQNPPGAHLDEDRTFLRLGYDREVSFGAWSTVVSLAHSSGDQLRGFLTDIATDLPNAAGVEAEIDQDDLYFDTHVATPANGRWRAVAGLDYLYGEAEAKGETFDYAASLAGEAVPEVDIPGDEREIRDQRGFAGLYANLELTPAPRWRLEGGLRLSHTDETRREGGEEIDGEDRRSDTRLSGAVGATWTAWQREESALRLFANAKSTFKPAAIDFNLSEVGAEGEEGGEGDGILEPETARSWEAGLRADLLDRALHLELAGFLMDFDNLVVAQAVGGLPALANAGQARFKGVELSAVWRLAPAFVARGSFAVHDARFRNYLTEFDGVPTQLDGNRLEMSPRQLAALALTWSPPRGLFASAETHYVGSRYLNKRNTALADAYSTVSALVGWRADRFELRLAARNLTDRRDPAAESELGDAQYYRLPARRFDLAASVSF